MIRADKLKLLPSADIRAMTLACNEVGGINLSQGVCDLPTPQVIRQAAIEAIQKDLSVYAPAAGIPELRVEIAKKLKETNKISADSNSQILVTNGVTGGVGSVYLSLFNPGDEILLFEPYYGYHYNQAILANLVPRPIRLDAPKFQITPEILSKVDASKVKGIVLCSPSNPSGRMFSQAEVSAVMDFAKKHNCVVISDEIYEYFTYDGREHFSPGSNPDWQDRVVTLMGFSKSFSITGWRLGYLTASQELVSAIAKANDQIYVCGPTPLQYGVLAGLKSVPQSYFDQLKVDFVKKRDQICESLTKAGLTPVIPEGSYYVLADVTKLGCKNSTDAAFKVLNEVGVASVPGSAFFQSDLADRYIRFCFAVDNDPLTEACRRIEKIK